MSEFSDKLSEYIAKSGSNVYQLAKEASLDIAEDGKRTETSVFGLY